MQTMVSYLDGEWESICKLLTVEEQPDVSADMFEYISPSCFSYKNSYPSFQLFPENHEKGSQENLSSQNDAVNSTYESGCFLDFPAPNDISLCFDFPMNGELDGLFGLKFLDPERNETISTDEGSSLSTLDTDPANNLISAPSPDLSLKRKPNAPVSQDEDMFLLAAPNKKARIRRTAQNRKTKAEAKGEEESAQSETVEEESEARQRQIIRCDNSEDESNNSEESYQAEDSDSNKSFFITSTGKKRASRGAATDPQSLYARRRRMRINERLRILQSLVPNGTKVDISTMLDEAFHYVKFLQLQIRLLSSDDLWMYAPLAYNGYDATVYKRMSPFLGLP